MAHIAKNAAIYIGGNIAAAAVPFLLLPLLTRVLSPAEYGVIAMFMALLTVLGAFTGLSVHGAINVRYVDRDRIDFRRYVGSCLSVVLASSAVVLAAVWLLRQPLAEFTSLPVLWVVVAVAVAASNSVVQVQLGVWLAQETPRPYAKVQFGRAFLDAGLSVVLVVLLLQGFEGRLWGRAITMFVIGGLALYFLSRPGLARLRPKWEYVRDALGFGMPLIPHVVGLFLLSAVDRFIINAYLGLDEAGYYMVAVQLGMGIQIATEAFNRAYSPWLYRQLREGRPQTLQRIVKGTWAYYALALSVAGAVALLADWLVNFVAGPDYSRAASALAWIAFGQAFHGMYLMVTNYTFYARKTAQLSGITLGTGLIALTLTYLLVPKMGVAGGGLSFAIAMLLKFLLTWMLAQHAYPMPWLLKKAA